MNTCFLMIHLHLNMPYISLSFNLLFTAPVSISANVRCISTFTWASLDLLCIILYSFHNLWEKFSSLQPDCLWTLFAIPIQLHHLKLLLILLDHHYSQLMIPNCCGRTPGHLSTTSVSEDHWLPSAFCSLDLCAEIPIWLTGPCCYHWSVAHGASCFIWFLTI